MRSYRSFRYATWVLRRVPIAVTETSADDPIELISRIRVAITRSPCNQRPVCHFVGQKRPETSRVSRVTLRSSARSPVLYHELYTYVVQQPARLNLFPNSCALKSEINLESGAHPRLLAKFREFFFSKRMSFSTLPPPRLHTFPTRTYRVPGSRAIGNHG